MAIPQFNEFCDQVCLMIRWKAARKPVADELTAHLEDHAAALEARGLDPETAARQAVQAMGDPYALGAELDAAHPPTLPRLSRVLLALGLLILLAALVLGFRQHTGLPALSGIRLRRRAAGGVHLHPLRAGRPDQPRPAGDRRCCDPRTGDPGAHHHDPPPLLAPRRRTGLGGRRLHRRHRPHRGGLPPYQ